MGDRMRTRCHQLLRCCACSDDAGQTERYGSPTRGFYRGLQPLEAEGATAACEAEYGGGRAEPWGAMVYGSNGLGQYTPRTAYVSSGKGDAESGWSSHLACLACFVVVAAALLLLAILREPSSHTAALYYDCSADLANWRTKWSRTKQEECCRREGRSCIGPGPWWSTFALSYVAAPGRSVLEQPELQAAMTRPSWASPPARSVSALSQSAGLASQLLAQPAPLGGRPATTHVGFNCSVDAVTWRRSWSVYKKAWCCQHKGSGCPPALPSATTASPQASGFICNQGATDGELDGWSRAKLTWCCDRHGVGCGGKPPPLSPC